MVLKDSFIFVVHAIYAKNMHIRSSHKENFHFKIPKNIEPNGLKVLDIAQDLTNEKDGLGKQMVILNIIDETLFYNVINPQYDTSTKEKVEEKDQYILQHEKIVPIGQHTPRFPYVVNFGDQQTLQIFNGNK